MLGSTRGGFGPVLLAGVAALVSLVVRYRRANLVEPEQIKWLVYAGAMILVAALLGSAVQAVVRPPDLGTEVQNTMVSIAFLLVPVAIGVAVLRYRLYDIDKTLVYGLLAAILAGVYVALDLGLGAIARSLGGTAQSRVVVAASTLTAAALFQPVRRRAQALMDRRFYRRKYDAGRTLSAFSVTLRSEVDLDSLRNDLLAVIREGLQLVRASWWFRDQQAGAP